MAYGIRVQIPSPVATYDAIHAEVMKANRGSTPDGFIAHICREVPDGFEITELWETKAQADQFNEGTIIPAMISAGVPMDGPPPPSDEFETHNLMIGQLG